MPRNTPRRPPGAGGRTDTLTQPQAAKVPTGMPYGQSQQLLAAQKVMPLPAAQTPAVTPASAPAPAAPPTASVAPAGGAPSAVEQAQAMPYREVGLAAPTGRPGEHVMTGAVGGPGPVAGPSNPQQGQVASMLSSVAHASGLPQLQQLADKARQLGQ